MATLVRKNRIVRKTDRDANTYGGMLCAFWMRRAMQASLRVKTATTAEQRRAFNAQADHLWRHWAYADC